jgi:hypothetical protein
MMIPINAAMPARFLSTRFTVEYREGHVEGVSSARSKNPLGTYPIEYESPGGKEIPDAFPEKFATCPPF